MDPTTNNNDDDDDSIHPPSEIPSDDENDDDERFNVLSKRPLNDDNDNQSDIDDNNQDLRYVTDEYSLDAELKYTQEEDYEDYEESGTQLDNDEEEPPPPMDEEDEIDEQYGFVLDSLLFPPHVKEQLMGSQTQEKKLMIIEMHKHLLANKKGGLWGDQQNSLLNLIRNSKRPDIQVLITLRSSLATANKNFLTGFLEADGIYVLMKCIDERIAKLPMTDLDASILYEIIGCCKCIMNNDTGMEAILVTPGAIEHIAKSLFFEWKPIALLVLEILSVCCYYTEDCSTSVRDGMKLLAKVRNEAPFQCLCQALLTEDVEVKSGVAVFVNSMLMGMQNLKDRNYFRAELTTQLYTETYEEVLRFVRDDLQRVEAAGGDILVESMISPKRTMIVANSMMATGADLSGYIQVGKGKNMIGVNPNEGTMAGVCITIVKEQKKFTVFKSGNKTKLQANWFELDGTSLKMCADSKEREPSDFKTVISMASVVFIRDYSTDTRLSKEVRFALELETTDDVISLGLENAFEKDCWMTALTVARDLAVMKRSAYRLVSKDLTMYEFKTHAESYIKQGTIYFSMLAEDREMVVTSSGLDTGDPLVLSEFLYHEMVAMGQSDQYHGLLQLLLLMPPGAPKLWEFLLKGVRRLIACCISDEEEMDDAFKIDMNKLVIMLESKAEELGGIYPQVSQLAMSVINKESELRQMKSDVDHSMNLLERVRSEMAEALQSVEEELARNGQLDGFLRQLIEPIIDIPERLLANGGLEDDDAMASRVRRRSSVSDMRYEVYTRLLKSLPEANIVRDRMLQDGFSDAEIADYFGTEADKIDPKRKSRSNSGSSLSKIFGAFTGMGGQEKSNSFSSSPPPLKDDKFKRLIKLLPPPLAREKMIEAGYLDKDIEEVVGPNDLSASVPVKATAPATAKPIDPKYEKYYKMMKILPEVAVRQKMGNEGFKEVEIDEFFQQLVDVAVATASGVSISAAPANAAPSVDPKFEKYVKMVKMLPEGAVRQKMAVEGLSPADIELFFTTVLPGLQNKPSTAPAPTAEVSKVATPAAADPKFEKYTKMLKMLPEGPVRQKMANDGISESDINAFFGGSSGGPAKPAGAAAAGGLLGGIKKPASTVELPPAGMKEKQNVAPTKKMKGLFWTKLKNTDVPGTLWSEVEEFQFPAESRELIDTLFSAVGKSAAVEGGDKEEAASKVKKEKNSGVVLFDGKRTQSVMIFLGRVRKLPREVAKMIILLEAKTMTLTMTETLLNVCPTPDELNLVKGYDQPHKLDVTGQLFHEFSRIPRLENRLKMYEITLKWDADATEAAQQVSTFLKACIELRRTKPLLGKLFGMVLSLGNYLNGGTARGQAYGVKLDFMAKLGTVKINPISKTANGPAVLCGPTVLHFLAIQAEKSAPEVINLAQAWESVWLAVEIPFQQMESDIKQLESQLQRTREELKVGIPLIQQERGVEASEPLKQRLTAFLQKAEPRMSNISQHLVEMTSTVKSTMTMFGEGQSGTPEEDTVSLFFTNLSTFIKAFNMAAQDNKRLQEEQEKTVRKQQEQTRMKEQKAARATLLERPNDADVAIDSKGIFADWKKNQSMQADQILNKHKSATGRKGMMGAKLSATSNTMTSGSTNSPLVSSASALIDQSTDAAGTRRGRRAGERQRPNIMKDER